MRYLITGVTGFAGSHLAEYLLSLNEEVYGTVRWRSQMNNINKFKHKIKLVEADIRDPVSVQNAINTSEPDFICHLAAQSFVPTSWHAPAETLTTNIIGNLNILEAMRKAKKDAVLMVAGSSEEYGIVHPNEVPIKETNELRAASPYGVSKIAQDKLTIQYHHSYGLKTIVTRAFNHEGPRRGDVFVISNWAKQITEMENEKRKPVLYVGNLDSSRDFTDVRDVVRAYHLALTKCKYGEVYNVCSGTLYPLQSVLDKLLKLSTIKNIKVEQDPSRLRPSDVQRLVGDCSKFRTQTGWKPEIPFDQTLRDTLDYWREGHSIK